MQLTKFGAAPVLQAEVPPCAPAGGLDGGTASQLIRSVWRTRIHGKSMAGRALIIWFVILVLANLNGAVRALWLNPMMGERPGHVVSTLTLSVVILILARASIGWVGVRSIREGFEVGMVWVVLTVAFEFLAGHYIFKKPWEALQADYHIMQGRIWVLVLVICLVSPVVAIWSKGK
jgi:hypothetical protein